MRLQYYYISVSSTFQCETHLNICARINHEMDELPHPHHQMTFLKQIQLVSEILIIKPKVLGIKICFHKLRQLHIKFINVLPAN